MFLVLMKIQKIIILFGLGIAVCFITGVADAFPSKARSLYFAETDQSSPVREKTHTVQKGESMWSISRKLDMEFSKVKLLNNLDNPDRIHPGQILILPNKLLFTALNYPVEWTHRNVNVEIQKDESVRVTAGPVESPAFPAMESQAIAHVLYPDAGDIFAPEVPVASYQKKDMISQQRGTRTGAFTVVFKSFLEFVQWLSGESTQHKQTQASGPHQVDPSPASPFTTSSAFHQRVPFGVGQNIFAQRTFFNSHISDSLSPPPKS